jgi:hypothetical protein
MSMRLGSAIVCTLLPLLPLSPLPARATLGEAPLAPPPGAVHAKASARAHTDTGFTIHQLQLASGTVVREYVSSDNRVFALKWIGPFMPDLPALLGSHIDQYAAATARPRVGRRPVEVRSGTLVIHAGGRPRAFEGYAYLPDRFPPGVTLADLD